MKLHIFQCAFNHKKSKKCIKRKVNTRTIFKIMTRNKITLICHVSSCIFLQILLLWYFWGSTILQKKMFARKVLPLPQDIKNETFWNVPNRLNYPKHPQWFSLADRNSIIFCHPAWKAALISENLAVSAFSFKKSGAWRSRRARIVQSILLETSSTRYSK